MAKNDIWTDQPEVDSTVENHRTGDIHDQAQPPQAHDHPGLGTTKDAPLSNAPSYTELTFNLVSTLPSPIPDTLDSRLGLQHTSGEFHVDRIGHTGFHDHVITGSTTLAMGGGTLDVTAGASATTAWQSLDRGQPANAPTWDLRVRVESVSTTDGTVACNPGAGVGDTSTGDWVGAVVDYNNGAVIRTMHSGDDSATTTNTLSSNPPSPPFTFLVRFGYHSIFTYTKEDGGDWVYHGDQSILDYLDNSIIATNSDWVPAVYEDTAASESISFGPFETGWSAFWGQRDHYPVTRVTDKKPLVKDGALYLTQTIAGGGQVGSGSNPWTGNFQAVFKLDLDSYRRELIGIILFEDGAGNQYHNFPTEINWDPNANEWIILVSTWAEYGDAEVHVGRTTDDPLYGVTRVETQSTNIPGTADSGAVYDKSLVYDEGSSGDPWRLSYTDGTVGGSFGGTRVVETADDTLTSGWSSVAYDDATSEGSRITKIGGEFVVGAGARPPELMAYPDLTTKSQVVTDIDPDGAYVSHPCFIAVPDGDQTQYLLLAFDDTRHTDIGDTSHGGGLVYVADQTADGYEWEVGPFGFGA